MDAGFKAFAGFAAGLGGEAFAFGVLVIALPGYDGVEQVAERVRVLDGPDPDVVLERP